MKEIYKMTSEGSVLDVEVSCFDSYQGQTPRPVNLLNWLQSDKYADQIIKLRQIKNKQERDRIKAGLPAITVSGLFHPKRGTQYLFQHSGLICIDINYKDNRHIQNYDQLKEQIFNIEHIAYASLSASGKGYFAIIPIRYPECHAFHFNALEADFSRLGIVIDKAPKSVASLRGCSYDTKNLFRKKSIIYNNILYTNKLLKRKSNIECMGKRQSPNHYSHSFPNKNVFSTKARVEATIQSILSNKIDVTNHEPDWFILACSLANEFGEPGRDYFHAISQFHPKYDIGETNQKYTRALISQYMQIGIGSFFKIAGQYLQIGIGLGWGILIVMLFFRSMWLPFNYL